MKVAAVLIVGLSPLCIATAEPTDYLWVDRSGTTSIENPLLPCFSGIKGSRNLFSATVGDRLLEGTLSLQRSNCAASDEIPGDVWNVLGTFEAWSNDALDGCRGEAFVKWRGGLGVRVEFRFTEALPGHSCPEVGETFTVTGPWEGPTYRH